MNIAIKDACTFHALYEVDYHRFICIHIISFVYIDTKRKSSSWDLHPD